MPLITILVLAGTVIAFVVFGLVLAWADRQTSKLTSREGSLIEGPRHRPF